MTLKEANKELEKLENDYEFFLNEKAEIEGIVLPKSPSYQQEKVDGGKRQDLLAKYVELKDLKAIDETLNYISRQKKSIMKWIENELKIFSDDNANDSTNRQTICYKLQKPLQLLNDTSDEFVLEPIFKGNKVQMNAYVMRKLAQTITKESISTGDDLSGTTISLTLARLMLFSETNIMESKNYKIVDKTDTEEDGTQIETIALRTSDNLLVDILFQYDGTHHVLLKNTEEYVLPDDFGIVTYTYETRFENLDYYIKKVMILNKKYINRCIIN